MKHIATIALAASLSGCAGLPGQDEPPHYDYQQQAMIAPGFPVARTAMPAGFEFADRYAGNRRQAHESPDDHGVARVEEASVSWVNPDDETAVATVIHQSASPGSYWQSWRGADGYEFIGDQRFQYRTLDGPYSEMAGDAGSIPANAPECAQAVTLVTYSLDKSKRTVFTYAEGLKYCALRLTWGEREKEALRKRAYQAFGLQ